MKDVAPTLAIKPIESAMRNSANPVELL